MESSGGDIRGQQYELDADGTARHATQFRTLWIDYNLGDTDDEEVGRWSVRGDVLEVIDHQIPLVTTPNCRLLEVHGKLFLHWGAVADCPLGAPALTEAEAALVGAWKLVEAATKTSPRTVERLTFETDRALSLTAETDGYDPLELLGYWTLDEAGTLHVTWPDGTEVLTGDVTTSGRSLQFCGQGGCVRLSASK